MTGPTRLLRQRPATYYEGGQRVWSLRRLTCTNTKIASPHLIAPVIAVDAVPSNAGQGGGPVVGHHAHHGGVDEPLPSSIPNLSKRPIRVWGYARA